MTYTASDQKREEKKKKTEVEKKNRDTESKRHQIIHWTQASLSTQIQRNSNWESLLLKSIYTVIICFYCFYPFYGRKKEISLVLLQCPLCKDEVISVRLIPTSIAHKHSISIFLPIKFLYYGGNKLNVSLTRQINQIASFYLLITHFTYVRTQQKLR